MCGLFGVAGPGLGKNAAENIIFLGYLAATRGIDSTGVCTVEKWGKNNYVENVIKAVCDPVAFLKDTEVKKELMTLKNPQIIMGHSRWATLGAVNEHNAHPIEEDQIILAHNGSIPHFLKDRNDEKDSDSRELARRLSKDGYPAGLRSIGSGAAATSIINTRARTLSFYRNSDRPLCFMSTKAGHQLYWASEMWMLYGLRTRENIGWFDDPYVMKPGILFTLDYGATKGRWVDIHEKKDDKSVIIIPPKPAALHHCRWCKKLTALCKCAEETTVLEPVKKEKETSVPETKGKVTYRGWNSEIYPLDKVGPLLYKGCSNCKASKHVGTKVHWFSAEHFACKDCYENDPMVKAYMIGKKSFESELVR